MEIDAVIHGSDGLDTCACLIASEKGGHGVPPGFDRGENAMLARERITRGQPALVFTLHWNEFARTDQSADPQLNGDNSCRQTKIQRRFEQSLERKGRSAMRAVASRRRCTLR